MSYVITDAFEGKQYIYDRKPEFMNGLQEILDKHKEKERAIYEHEF